MHPKNNDSFVPDKIHCNLQEINDPVEIANTFNNHFLEIVIKIASKLPYHDMTEVKSFLTNRISTSIFLEPGFGNRNNEYYRRFKC